MREFLKPSPLAAPLTGVIGDGSPLTTSPRSSSVATVSMVSSSSKESLLGAGVRLELDPLIAFSTGTDCSLLTEGVVE